MDLTPQEIPQALRFCRMNRELTLREVADETGVSLATLARLERADEDVSLSGDVYMTMRAWCRKYTGHTHSTGDAVHDICAALFDCPHLTPEQARALCSLITIAYNALAR